MKRKTHLRAVVAALQQSGQVDIWNYLIAFQTACDVLGGKLPGPLGGRGYHERMFGMCFAAVCNVPARAL